MKPKKPPSVTIEDLTAALGLTDRVECADVFDRYRKQKPTADAIPILRQALADEYHYIVKVAALALGKLGPAAVETMEDLLIAAARIDPISRAPQVYAVWIIGFRSAPRSAR